MRLLKIIFPIVAGLFSACCAHAAHAGKPTDPSPQPIVVAATVRGPDGAVPDGMTAWVRTDDAAHPGPYTGAIIGGRLSFTLPAGSQMGWQLHAHVDAPGLLPWDGVGGAHTNGELCPCTGADGVSVDEIHLASAHVDPSTFSLSELAAIRGAMWGTRWNGAYGPRPGQADNILATDFYQLYPADERARMLAIYTSRGYTHAVSGPVSGTDCYHGDYPCHDPSNPGWFPQDGAPSQAQWDAYLDRLEDMWDAGLKPIVFLHPDGWNFEQTRDAFTPLLQQPRAQRLIRILVPTGWEPTKYDWSSCTWARFAQWARQTLPNALILIHTVSDVDAPVGVDDLCNDNNNPNGNADGWARVAPYIHGWLIQNGPYPAAPANDPEHRQPFCDQFNPEVAHTVAWEFVHNGWPQFSAWGEQRIRLYNAENTAYTSYWNNLPEDASRDWGDLAMSCGADGYMDGGRSPVPVR